MAATVLTLLRVLYRKLFCLEEWNVGTIALPPGGVKELIGRDSLGDVTWRVGAWRTSFLADPFIWTHPVSPRVLVEEFDYWSGRGRIASLPLEGLEHADATRAELVLPQHASYPHVFRSDDDWYCIPECAESFAVNLYIWDAQSDVWRFDSRLLQGIPVYDPTPFAQNGVWYLFGTNADDGPQSRLRIWFSHSLRGPWQAHPLNPARIATDQVRSAGPIFCIEGCLYRPSQDGRQGYGSGIILNRIDCLSPSAYLETPVREWHPQKHSIYGAGLHTISFTATVAVIDGKRVRFSPWAALWKCWWKILKMGRRVANS